MSSEVGKESPTQLFNLRELSSPMLPRLQEITGGEGSSRGAGGYLLVGANLPILYREKEGGQSYTRVHRTCFILSL